MDQRIVAAAFESREDANWTAHSLMEVGLARGAIRVLPPSAGRSGESEPDYRGGIVVCALVRGNEAQEAEKILSKHGALNLRETMRSRPHHSHGARHNSQSLIRGPKIVSKGWRLTIAALLATGAALWATSNNSLRLASVDRRGAPGRQLHGAPEPRRPTNILSDPRDIVRADRFTGESGQRRQRSQQRDRRPTGKEPQESSPSVVTAFEDSDLHADSMG
ncbi:MAG: hypothetical protein JWM36_1026 [Hyphomicrobiales bacterium]|nr:hypothetical protein [Hyphomicrobiales bacterium]